MNIRNHNQERRIAQRFELHWEVAVKGTDRNGASFDESATLRNLSSLGALLDFQKRVNPGERVELLLKIPFRRNNRIAYEAHVVRVDEAGVTKGVAVRFDSARPMFKEQ